MNFETENEKGVIRNEDELSTVFAGRWREFFILSSSDCVYMQALRVGPLFKIEYCVADNHLVSLGDVDMCVALKLMSSFYCGDGLFKTLISWGSMKTKRSWWQFWA